MALWPYAALAFSFAWAPALVFVAVARWQHVSTGAELAILLSLGAYLMMAIVGVIRSRRKSRWVFAVLNGIALTLDASFILVIVPLSGGIYH